MVKQKQPFYPLADIQAAVAARNYYLGKPARVRLSLGKWTVADIEAWVAGLTASCYCYSDTTTDPANPGQKFDCYKYKAAIHLMWLKFELLGTGEVEIISVHETR